MNIQVIKMAHFFFEWIKKIIKEHENKNFKNYYDKNLCDWLGYVGLPILLRLSNKYKCVGFDNNLERINDLKR